MQTHTTTYTYTVQDRPSYPNLTTLQLTNKQVTNLKQTLPLLLNPTNQQSKLEIIANDNKLKNVEGLDFVCQRLVSIKSLGGIQGMRFMFLEKIYLEYNQIENIDGLAQSQFPVLIRLSLNNNKLTSQTCSPILHLQAPQLRVLALDSNTITSLNFLTQIKILSKLIDVSLSNNQITDIRPLGDCIFMEKLSKLELQGNRILCVPVLGRRMVNLRKFILSNNQISSIQGLISCQFPLLEIFEAENNSITDLHVLKRVAFPKLVDLKLSKNRIVRMPINQLRYGTYPMLQQILLKNNEIAGNKIIDFQTAFADVRELREKTYQNLGPQQYQKLKTQPYQLQKTHPTTSNVIKNTKLQTFNDNKVFSMISCWRNKLVTVQGPQTYAKMKGHFNKLSFLEF